MKRIPVLIQLIAILSTALIIPTSIVTYYTGTSMMEYSTAEIATSAMEKNLSTKQLSEVMFSNVIQDMLQVVGSNTIRRFNNIRNYEELNANYENISSALNILTSLEDIMVQNNLLYSVVFYLADADYVISTNKGIVRLEQYEQLDWLKEAEKHISGAEGIWYPRELNTATIQELERGNTKGNKIPVISYVYRLSRLTTSTKGTIIINIYEDGINRLINSEEQTEISSGYIIDTQGVIISHKDKTKVGTSVSKSIGEKIKGQSGYYYSADHSYINAYSKSKLGDWTYITEYSLDHLMEKAYALQTKSLILSAVVIIVGIACTIIVASRFSKPMRKLVKDMRIKNGINLEKNRNELAFLSTAFEAIQIQEEELHGILKARETETKKITLHNVLMGEELSELAKKELDSIFEYRHFMVAMIAVDHKLRYSSDTTHEVRIYQRYLISQKIQEVLPEGYKLQCVRYSSGMIAVIFNMETYDYQVVGKVLQKALNTVRMEAKEIMGTTVTIGLSSVHSGYEKINDCTFEANEAVKRRLLVGGNSVIFWTSNQKENYKYHYFYNSEKKIMNYLDTRDFESLQKEMTFLMEQIKEEENISNDNILLIYYQLVGSTIKYMAEHSMNTSKVFGANANIYSIIANLDTIDQITEYLIQRYESIIEYMSEGSEQSETRYCEQIVQYLKEHYKEDIVFEDLAINMGISYSYLRKLVKEETGKSLLDNVNSMRIEEVKRLLLHSDLSLVQIATEVGYHNTQSMSRFFKKFEGISPGEFKSSKV